MLQQHIQKDKLFWEFCYQHFQWEKQTFNLNNMQMETPIPLFPRELLPPIETQEKAPIEFTSAPTNPNININTTPAHSSSSDHAWLGITPSQRQALVPTTANNKKKTMSESPEQHQEGTKST